MDALGLVEHPRVCLRNMYHWPLLHAALDTADIMLFLHIARRRICHAIVYLIRAQIKKSKSVAVCLNQKAPPLQPRY